jgi:FKBP-type peptidyl-prolyl cis-trans isomerase FkpA
MRRILALAGALSLSACLNLNVDGPNGPAADNPSDPATETFASSLNINVATMQKTSSGVYYKDVKVGTGDSLSTQANVVVSYLVFLKNAAVVTQQVDVTESLASELEGFRDGVAGMRAGGERILVIPSALGFGPRTDVPGVPPNSTLVYDVILSLIP